jgi:hypothetical protein
MTAKQIWAIALAASFGALGCDDDEDVDGLVTPVVDVTLQEFTVTVDPPSAAPGQIQFSVYNGGSETHEFVVVKTDLAVADLPTQADGSFDEEGDGVEVMDEIEDIPSGGTRELMVSLEAGAYVLLCNIVEAEGEESESHFHEGMHTPFMVQ